MNNNAGNTPPAFFANFGRGTFRSGRLVVEETRLLEAIQAVREYIDLGWKDAVGWLCFTDGVLVSRRAGWLLDFQGRRLLSGELALPDRSLHLRQAGPIWQAVAMATQEAGDGILERVRLLSADRASPMVYDVAWSLTSLADSSLPPAYEASFARFVGFADD